MKVDLVVSGLGIQISEESQYKPKSTLEIGGYVDYVASHKEIVSSAGGRERKIQFYPK